MVSIFRRLGVAATLVVASACVPLLSRSDSGVKRISSEGSDYSPQVRFDVARLEVSDSTVFIELAGGSVAVPGNFTAGSPPVMSDVKVRVLTVRFQNNVGETERPWSVIDSSDYRPIASTLQYGERKPIAAPINARLPLPRDSKGTGFVLEVRGTAVTAPVRLEDGRVLNAAPRPDGIRVFACSSFDLRARESRTRARQLARRYTAQC